MPRAAECPEASNHPNASPGPDRVLLACVALSAALPSRPRRAETPLRRCDHVAQRIALSLLCFVSTAAWSASASAGPFDVNDATWEGGEQVYALAKEVLGAERVKPVATLEWSKLEPNDGILVLHPEQALDPVEASEFMKLGGRIGVLDDFGEGDELFRRFKIERVPLPAPPLAALRNNPNLALAEPYLEVSAGQIGAPHPIAGAVKRLVLNHPMALVHPDLSPVLKVRLKGTSRDAIVAVAGQVEKGRLFAMSDPSAVINSMLRYPGNRAFAQGVVRYLASDADRTGGTLYIVTNSFRQEGSVGGERTLARAVESQVRQMVAALAETRREGLPDWAMTLLAGLLLAGVAAWIAKNSLRSYRTPLPRYAAPIAALARGGAPGRVALLAAPTSPRALVLLELKTALAEAIAHRYGLGVGVRRDALVAAVRDDTGDDALASRVDRVLERMGRAEAAMVSQADARVGRDELAEASTVTAEVVARIGALEPRARPRALASPSAAANEDDSK